jgi:phosphoribosyl 1,2-cyclic phosphodiesterase
MKYAILASGSSGNASLVWTEKHCLVVEAGIPMRRMLALKSAARCMLKPDGILLSHDHLDHAGFAEEASRYWHCPIFCSKDCWQALKDKVKPWDVRVFDVGQGFHLPEWGFYVQSIPVAHTQGSVGFRISTASTAEHDFTPESRKVCILTDLGGITDEIREYAKPCHVLAIEANYSVAMMAENEEYHEKLKKRLMAGYGHLSNNDIEAFLASQEWPNLHTVALIHMSRANNLVPLALAAAKRGLNGRGNVKTVCAWSEFPLVMEV